MYARATVSGESDGPRESSPQSCESRSVAPPATASREHQGTRLLAMSFDAPISPSIELRALEGAREHAYGWGFAWYPEAGPSAMVIKDPTSIGENPMTKLLRDWERFQSTVFVCHLRGAARTLTEQDTHPFSLPYAGRSFVLAHNGDLVGDLGPGPDAVFAPLGRTDSERAFCWILERVRREGGKRLADVGWERLHGWLRELDEMGTANFLLTDGIDLVVHRDAEAYNTLYSMRLTPPHGATRWSTPDIEVDLSDAEDLGRSAVLVSTIPLAAEGDAKEGWIELAPSQMLVLRRGSVIHDSHAGASAARRIIAPPRSLASAAPIAERPALVLARPEGRVLRVTHTTRYSYEQPVERSKHLFRLQPCHDLGQELLDHALELSCGGLRRSYEDVFGNAVVRAEVEEPYDTLEIAMRTTVRIRNEPPADLQSPVRRWTIPLVWMPWQRQMMLPYLLPPELPETQLQELNEFAMSFVERQDSDLVQTLLDMNTTIYRDFQYVSGSTTLATTPFDVYVTRKGVCQDFANLFICMARLLGIPARYRVGYIYTGGQYENKVQSDASHAWAELYLPWSGWIGFDPTNGILAGRDHVRVACGRNYRDATPTDGTLFKGGAGETLSVSVKVEEA